jgi:phosphate transport system substrate-binding protein
VAVTPADRLGLRGLWVFVTLALVGLAGASLAVLGGLGRGAAPPFLTTPPRAHTPSQAVRDPHTLRLAGSGTNVPVTRRLAAAFAAGHPGRHVVVHESIGSTGGIRAVADGAVSLGLLSRPLRPRERRLSLRVIPYARVAVVIAAHPDVGDEPVTRQGLLDLYSGTRQRWRNGRRVHVVQRERGDSALLAVGSALPGFEAVDRGARRTQRWRVVYQDNALREALLATPGAVGLFDLGAILSDRLSLRVLAYEGHRPSAADPLPAGYPFHKDLAFVSAGPPAGLAAAFLGFVASAAGADILRRHGYLPRSGDRP